MAYNYATDVMVHNLTDVADAKEGIESFINKRAPKWSDQ